MKQNKNISIKQIAKLSGVSVATVSRVINNNGRFSEETRERVMKIINEYNYTTNMAAKSLRVSKSKTIGVIVPDVNNGFFSELVLEIEKYFFSHGYSVFICNTNQDEAKEKSYFKSLDSKLVDGIICISAISIDPAKCIKRNIPVVFINNKDYKLERDGVNFTGTIDMPLLSDYDLPSYLVIKNGNTEKVENAKGLFNYDRNMSEIINYYGSISYKNEILKLKGNLETNISYLSGSYQDGILNEIHIDKYTVDILENNKVISSKEFGINDVGTTNNLSMEESVERNSNYEIQVNIVDNLGNKYKYSLVSGKATEVNFTDLDQQYRGELIDVYNKDGQVLYESNN